MGSTTEMRLELESRPTSAGEARRFVERALSSSSTLTRETGVLLTSELVTNALLYTQGGIILRVTPSEEAYRISVRDANSQSVRPRRVGPEATSGRGLALVEQLSSAWGVDQSGAAGKEVWFELPRH